MARILRIGGAQMGAIQKTDSRQVVVRRMLDLLDRAKAQNCDLVVYPELALSCGSCIVMCRHGAETTGHCRVKPGNDEARSKPQSAVPTG